MLFECLAIAKDPICSTPLLAMVLALAFFQNVHRIKVSLDWILKPELRELGALSTTARELASLTLNTQCMGCAKYHSWLLHRPKSNVPA